MSKIFPGGGAGLKTKLVTVVTTVAFSGAAALVPAAALADHTTAHLIEQLQAQIAALQSQLNSLVSDSGGSSGSVSCNFTRSLTVGSRGDDVKCLQQYLNSSGYTLASSGPGSPGNETTFFGPITRSGVIKWQDANAANVLTPLGLVRGTGFFGPSSRSHYQSLVAVIPPPPADDGGDTTPPPADDGDDDTPVAVGSGLTVSAVAVQPASTLAPASATRLPFVKAILTASADGDVTVDSVKVERRGLAEDAAFGGIQLLDENGNQLGSNKTLNSDHQVVLTEDFVIKAGTSRTMTIAAEMASSLTNQNGQVARLAIIDVKTKNDTAVNANFPIESNGMTVNSTLGIGTVTMTIGSLDPGSANTKDVGTKGYYFASVKASVGSAEDVTFKSIRFNQAGSAASGDLENVEVLVDGVAYPTTVSSDGKYYRAAFPNGIGVDKGDNIEFSIRGDILDGSDRTVDFNLLKKSDVVVTGDVFGYDVLASGGSAGSASAGAFSSNQEPFFNAYAATISKGSLIVSSSNQVSSTNIPIDVSDTVIGGFLIDVRGEPIQISAWTLNFDFTGSGTSSDLTNVKLVNENGDIAAGPLDPSSGTVAWTDTFTVPVGENHYKVLAKLDTSFATDDTIQVTVDPDGQITAKGETTGLSITPSPTTEVTANTQTVRAGALSMSVSATPFGQNVVRGINGFHFATLVFDATNSGEDVRVTTTKLRDTISAAGVGDEVNTCQLYDGSTALNTGSDVVDPSDPSGTTNDLTFTLTNNLIIPKGTVKNIDVKCNITSGATADSTHAFGLNDTTATNAVGAETSQSITESVTTGAGNTMTIKTAGSFTVVKDSSAQGATLVTAGKTDVPINALLFRATDEAVKIDEVTLTYSSSTASTSDFKKATLWDGATKLGEAVWAGTKQFATSTLSSDFIVPKDGSKVMTVKVDLASITVTASSTAGRLLAIDYDGIGSSSGTGQSSGANLGSLSGSNTIGSSMQIMKTVPKLEKVSIPSTSLVAGEMILYRFKVTAPPEGPIALYKVTFDVSSSSVSATTSNFAFYGYSDSGFSTSAYNNNPLHQNNTDCAGASSIDSESNCASFDANPGSATASSTEVVFFLDDKTTQLASSTEALTIPANGTRYFELRGDVSNPGAGTGNSIQIRLLGDAARIARSSAVTTDLGIGRGGCGSRGDLYLCTAAEAAMQSANNDFVWSPMSTSTSLTGATSTPDWANGFLIPGLPSTNLSGNTISN